MTAGTVQQELYPSRRAMQSPWTRGVMITPLLLRQNDAVMSFWRNTDVILTLCVSWDDCWQPWSVPWASYQIRKIACCACAGNAWNVFPHRRLQRKPLVSDPGMHHGTCVTHVPWCMSGSLTRGGGETVPGIPGACAPAILRIWQEPHTWWYPGPNFNIKLSCEYMYMTSRCDFLYW